jgi:hypothetical protein
MLSFANFSDLLEHLNISQSEAEQEDIPRKRHGKPGYSACIMKKSVPQRSFK